MGALSARVDGLGIVLADYVEKARVLLDAHGRAVNRVVEIAPGVTPAWDDACSQLYARVVQIQPVVDQNTRGTAFPCGITFYVATVAMAVTRCVATVESGKKVKLPSAEQVTADGFAMIDDMVDLESVIRCHSHTRGVLNGQPLAEQGGLAGFEWTWTIRLAPCECPSEG